MVPYRSKHRILFTSWSIWWIYQTTLPYIRNQGEFSAYLSKLYLLHKELVNYNTRELLRCHDKQNHWPGITATNTFVTKKQIGYYVPPNQINYLLLIHPENLHYKRLACKMKTIKWLEQWTHNKKVVNFAGSVTTFVHRYVFDSLALKAYVTFAKPL